MDLITWALSVKEPVRIDSKVSEFIRIVEILTEGNRRPPQRLMTPLLNYVESQSPASPAPRALNQVFGKMSFRSQANALRLQQLFVEQKIEPDPATIDVMEKFPVLLPQFSKLMKAYMKDLTQHGTNFAERTRMNRLIREIPNCEDYLKRKN